MRGCADMCVEIVNSTPVNLYHHIAPGVLHIKEMKSLFILASVSLKAAILSFENLEREKVYFYMSNPANI